MSFIVCTALRYGTRRTNATSADEKNTLIRQIVDAAVNKRGRDLVAG
jgi:hypothetical protein